jgi:Mg/Co/Ni transporter MgtE
MSTITHDRARAAPERRRWSAQILVREMWASLAISVMWLAVLFAAVFAPDIVSSSNDGNSTTISSAVAVALFAAIGTRVVAKYGFARRDDHAGLSARLG